MPELPEVETIRRNLRQGWGETPSILGRRIEGARLLWERSLAEPGPGEFLKRVSGQTITEIGRRGKFLVFSLSDDWLLIHLRMSGDILIEPSNAPVGPHYRAVFELEPDYRMVFNDARKFGRIWLLQQPQSLLGRLGPEPFDEDLDSATFHRMLNSACRRLKPALTDQSFLAGLGNIYTDEALNRARLHPLTLTNRISPVEACRLLASIRETLEDGMRRNGTSIDWVYRGGDFQNYLRVYGRKGQACLECGTPIERILIGQRSTYYCPNCQVTAGEIRI